MTARDPTAAWFDDPGELLERTRRCAASNDVTPQVAGYHDLALFRRGGQGAVYLATRTRDGLKLALKVFHEQTFASKRATQRFEREIHLVAKLRHPCIVNLHGWGRTRDGRAYLSMEFVAGHSFSEVLEGASFDERLALFEDVGEAVLHAHRRGVLHRDLKPGNLRVDHYGRVRLLDFGLARSLDLDNDEASVTITGEFLGTLSWASPEQLDGDVDLLDTRSDLYSLGLLLYWAFAERLPFPTDLSAPALLRHRQQHAPLALRRCAPELPRDLETVVMRCLAGDPERRYGSVSELLAELGRLRAGQPIAARRDSLRVMLGELVRRHRAMSWVLGGASLLLIASSVTALLGWQGALAGEQRARHAEAERRAEADKVAAVNEFLIGALLGPVSPAEVEQLSLASAIERAAKRVETDTWLVDRPGVRADLHQAFAYWFGALPERLTEAQQHIDQSWQLEVAKPEPSANRLASLLQMRGVVALRAGDPGMAIAHFEASLERADDDPLNDAHCLMQSAQAHLQQGLFEAALERLEACVPLFEAQLGVQHSQTVAARNGRDMVAAQLDSAP